MSYSKERISQPLPKKLANIAHQSASLTQNGIPCPNDSSIPLK